MARQIAYDPAQVKQDIMTLFWAKGYAEASLADLEESTGLNRRQLYNGIGDKRAMFLQALDDFTYQSGQLFLAPLESETAGIRDIQELFATFIDLANQPEGANGCMVCSTSQEEIAEDEVVADRMNAFFDRIRAAHRNALTCAASRGEMSLGTSEIDRKADSLFGAHVSLCILGRAGRPRQQLQHIADQAVSDLI